jgi:predicted Zn-dependent protease
MFRWTISIVAVAFGLATGARTQGSRADLYFVAVGPVPVELLQGLASHVQSKYGAPSTTLEALALDATIYDERRKQAIAESLVQFMRARYPTLAASGRARVIGITAYDMYMRARPDWRFSFSTRSGDQRFAVVSYARMDPGALGSLAKSQLAISRLRKMVAKNVGMMYFGLPPNRNPRSVLYDQVLGIDDLDRMTDDFNPK